MTLGHEGAKKLNDVILEACVEKGWMMGVGSQRRQLFDPSGHKECEGLRKKFPKSYYFWQHRAFPNYRYSR
jgi:isopentenyl-diphosphate delta-isomerase